MKTICVLFGGKSSEFYVSCKSAYTIITHIPREKYKVLPVGITQQGDWYLYEGDIDLLPEAKWLESAEKYPACFLTNSRYPGLTVFRDTGMEQVAVDAVFPVLHGKNGEDGTIQGLFDMSMVPYVGCGVCSSALCMDKAFAHAVLEGAGIKMAPYVLVKRADRFRPEQIAQKVVDTLGFPVFVKPANAGSSVGVSKAKDENELEQAVKLAFAHDHKVLIEKAISGIEVECAVLGNQDPEASVLGEITPGNEFYDYEAKYEDAGSQLHIPARISQELSYQIRDIAVRAFKTLDCAGLARVDFFVTPAQEVYLNELNTMPGFTSISMYPKLWQATGMGYDALLDRLIQLAMERAESNG